MCNLLSHGLDYKTMVQGIHETLNAKIACCVYNYYLLRVDTFHLHLRSHACSLATLQDLTHILGFSLLRLNSLNSCQKIFGDLHVQVRGACVSEGVAASDPYKHGFYLVDCLQAQQTKKPKIINILVHSVYINRICHRCNRLGGTKQTKKQMPHHRASC